MMKKELTETQKTAVVLCCCIKICLINKYEDGKIISSATKPHSTRDVNLFNKQNAQNSGAIR